MMETQKEPIKPSFKTDLQKLNKEYMEQPLFFRRMQRYHFFKSVALSVKQNIVKNKRWRLDPKVYTGLFSNRSLWRGGFLLALTTYGFFILLQKCMNFSNSKEFFNSLLQDDWQPSLVLEALPTSNGIPTRDPKEI